MNHWNKFSPLLLALPVGLVLSGCGHTLGGAKEDVSTDTQKTAQAAQDTGHAIKTGAQETGAAVATGARDVKDAAAVTPEVKTAIIRDPVLNNPANLVNVSASGKTVTLTGHVGTASMKQRATEDAQASLSGHHHVGFKVVNNLTAPAS